LGTGDQEGYPDKFMDAIGILAEKLAKEVKPLAIDR
jgi:hypothetical protein